MKLCLFPALAALVLACAVPVHAADPSGVPNFHTVAPGIYRGGAPTTAGLQQLKALGVKTVIDLRGPILKVRQEGQIARGMGLRWINLPMGSDPPTPQEVATLLVALKQAPAQPVFVHCQHGADRTGCMIGIYRVTQEHWTFPQAWAEMRHDGFNPRWTKLTAAVRQRAPRG